MTQRYRRESPGFQGRPSTMFDSRSRARRRAALIAVLSATAAGSLLGISLAVGQQQPAPAPAAQPAPGPMAPASTPEQEALRTVPAKGLPGKTHLLPAT